MSSGKLMRCIGALILFALPPGIQAERTAKPVELFEYRSERAQGRTSLERAGARRVIAISDAAIADDPDSFHFQLPDGRSYEAFRKSSWARKDGARHWNGEAHLDGAVEDMPDGFVFLTLSEGLIAGSLQLGGTVFDIVPLDPGRQELVEILPAGAGQTEATCAVHHEALTAEEAVTFEKQIDESLAKGIKGGGFATIDVLVVYPRSYLNLPPEQQTTFRARIDNEFALADQVFRNSMVDARYRPVYIGPLFEAQQPPINGTAEAALDWLRQSAAVPATEVARLRLSLGADLVLLVIPGNQDNDICGAALGNGKFVPGDQVLSRPLAVIEESCSTSEYLVAHELGHVLGLQHALGETGVTHYDNGRGFDDDNNLRVITSTGPVRAATAMACNGDQNGEPSDTATGNQCNRLPYFSGPDIRFGGINGVVLGTPTANNAQVARVRAPVAAGLMAAVANPLPLIRIERPVGDNLQQHQLVTLKATASDSQGNDISARIRWSSTSTGVLGTGGTIQASFSSLGANMISAEVRDDQNQLAVDTKMVQVRDQVLPSGAVWRNPSRPGEFLSFNMNQSEHWVATLMTNVGGTPIWFLSDVELLPMTGVFTADLLSYTRDVATRVQTGTVAGSLTLAVETDRQLRVTYHGLNGGGSFLLDPYTDAYPSGAYWSLIPSEPSMELQVDPGWMFFRGLSSSSGGTNRPEIRFLITFDGSQPVWVLGEGVCPSLPSPCNTTMMYQTPTTATQAGFLAIHEITPATVTVNLTFPSGNTWTRDMQRFEPATIR